MYLARTHLTNRMTAQAVMIRQLHSRIQTPVSALMSRPLNFPRFLKRMLLPPQACLCAPSTCAVKVPTVLLTASSARVAGRIWLELQSHPAATKQFLGTRCQSPASVGLLTADFSHRGGLCSNCCCTSANLANQARASAHFPRFLTFHRCAFTRWDGWRGAASRRHVAFASMAWVSPLHCFDIHPQPSRQTIL